MVDKESVMVRKAGVPSRKGRLASIWPMGALKATGKE